MFAKIENGNLVEYPYSIHKLKKDNPSVSYPKTMTDEEASNFGLHRVSFLGRPSFNEETEKLVSQNQPSLVDGVWSIGWDVVAKTDEELAADVDMKSIEARGKRDGLLQETDIYGLSDLIMTAEMAAYRQALRDIPEHVNFPSLEDSDWPVKP